MLSRFHFFTLLASLCLPFIMTNDGVWGDWDDWSECSRTCGGGVTQQKRNCTSNNATSTSCSGESVRYQICNIQDCPEDAIDFRMFQCAQYDKKPYKGKTYRWASFDHNAGECELKCMPKGQFFYVTFKNKVIDGTKCNSHTQNICIDGKCESVGCDMQLHSNATIDMCGVCNGKNDTCKYIGNEFQFTSDAYGYVDVVTIPSGATSIKISEVGTPNNYIELSNSEKNIMNGEYNFIRALTQKFDSGTLRYVRTNKINQVHIDGPIELPLKFRAFAFSPAGAVMKYSYYVPNSFTGNAHKKVNYDWITEQWGECTKTCAGGERFRKVFCGNSLTKEKVANFNCEKSKKPANSGECNTQRCPSRWYISDWAECSVSCGRGRKTRRVHCVETLSDGNIKMLDEGECEGNTPSHVQDCVVQEKCPEWLALKWTPCSKTCGEGLETRTVHCMDMQSENSVEENQCSIENKPATERKCFNAPCDSSWDAEEWGECSANCGVGMRSRTVICRSSKGYEVPSSYCNKDDEPSSFEDCEAATGPCKPEWHATQWSKCTARCSYGNQMRMVVCAERKAEGDDTLYVVDNKLCDPKIKPVAMRRCYNVKPCHINYFVDQWSKCSATCGMGFQQREVKCYADQQIDYSFEACANLVEPPSVKLCKLQPCEGERPLPTEPTTTTTTPVTAPKQDNEAPYIVALNGNANLHEGDNADFECIVNGYPKPTIEWTLNGRPISESKRFSSIDIKRGNRLVILAAILSDAGRLACIARNKVSKVSKNIYVKVSGVPSIKVSPNTAIESVGNQHKIECKATGSPSPRVQWTKDGYTFRGDYNRVIVSSRGITFKRLKVSDTGTYRCMGFNSAGTDYASSLLSVTRQTSPQVCYDDNSKANCLIIAQTQLCHVAYYKEVCCESCQGRRL